VHGITIFFRKQSLRLFVIVICTLGLSACIGTVVGAVVDTAIEVAKIPFKVGGAIIDVATPDDESSDFRQSIINAETEVSHDDDLDNRQLELLR